MIAQPDLPFAGPDLTSEDRIRLGTQLYAVRKLMADGEWRTLREIATACGCSEAGASARLRDLRKPWAGRHTVERKRYSGGLWLYRVLKGRQ